MNGNDPTGYALACVLGAGGAVIGYYIPIVGVVLTVFLILILIAALLGDEGGAMVELLAAPFRALARWLGQKDDKRWLRRAPFIGLFLGWLGRWVANSLAASGGL
jgi:uncharacterized membrane protein YeaQ/YmgE (transglycosylase-associated protein family)